MDLRTALEKRKGQLLCVSEERGKDKFKLEGQRRGIYLVVSAY